MNLRIEISSYWHPGTSHGNGAHLDAITHRDQHGLPGLPGRTLKGLLRDAVQRAEQFGWYQESGITEKLFGTPTTNDAQESSPGLLRIGDAHLPAAERHYLTEEPDLIPGLYRSQFSTAIEHRSGSAQEGSLRGIELIIPLTLEATIQPISGDDDNSSWQQHLRTALPLIRAVGAHRSRGLGRAKLSLEDAA